MADLTRRLEQIRQAFPGLTLSDVDSQFDGLANQVIVVNHELVFRFPKSERARAALAGEARLLDLAARYVSVSVPRIEHLAEDFAMYRYLPGQPLYLHDLLRQPDAVQERLAEQVAGFLRQLHAIPREEAEQAGLGGAADSADRWPTLLADVERELFGFFWADQKAWVSQFFAPVRDGSLDMAAYAPALCHGDVSAYHLLVDPGRQRLTGVIDFGNAGLGDPANDFALIINTYGESFLRRMWRYYPEIDRALDRARIMAAALELEWALGGVRTKDPAWFLVHLGRARDMRPIGARP